MKTVAIVWSGDQAARQNSSLEQSRYHAVAIALKAVGLYTIGVVYNDEAAQEVEAELLTADAVLVWVNPLHQDSNRRILDAMLRELANTGVYVSTHPDMILKLGTKDVLYQTQNMSWGCETHRYNSMQELQMQLPQHLKTGPRVLKQYRGNDGIGIWKVQAHPTNAGLVRVRHAPRANLEQDMTFSAFYEILEPYFANNGRIIGQTYQQRITEGMIRCYLVQDKVVGFGHQEINALYPVPFGEVARVPTQRLYFDENQIEFQVIRQPMEAEWLPELCKILGIQAADLPMIWDADFLFGDQDSFVLCEINVSCVSPFPDSALEILAKAVQDKLSNLEFGS